MTSSVKDNIGLAALILWQSVKSFARNNNASVSASLAYYSLFAIIPLLLLLLFLLGFFIASSNVAMNRVASLISQFIPYYSDMIVKEIHPLSGHKGIWEILSIGALVWASTPLIGTLRTAFFDIFKISERPSYLRSKLLNIIVLLLTLSLLVIVSLASLKMEESLQSGGRTGIYGLTSFIITIVVLAVFLIVFAPVRVPLPYILAGSVFTTLLWALMRPVFGLFLTYNPNYGLAFGSLKALFVVLMWIYYSFTVLLFGAEIVANLRRKDVIMLRNLFYDKTTDKAPAKLTKTFGRTYGPGEFVFKEGDKGEEMFYVMSGRVRVLKNEQTLKVMGKGDYFGEMALLIGTARTTSAVADEDKTVLIRITPGNLETLLREEPKIAISFLKELAMRLKNTDEFIH